MSRETLASPLTLATLRVLLVETLETGDDVVIRLVQRSPGVIQGGLAPVLKQGRGDSPQAFGSPPHLVLRSSDLANESRQQLLRKRL